MSSLPLPPHPQTHLTRWLWKHTEIAMRTGRSCSALSPSAVLESHHSTVNVSCVERSRFQAETFSEVYTLHGIWGVYYVDALQAMTPPAARKTPTECLWWSFRFRRWKVHFGLRGDSGSLRQLVLRYSLRKAKGASHEKVRGPWCYRRILLFVQVNSPHE